MNQLRELSLYTGTGGGLLGSILLGHKIIGAVEIDSYCCRVLEQRQKDGVLERFPIFNTDIRDFIREGYAGIYKGCCDIVSGGFPCQPFSVAGKREGDKDSRNMWPATLEVIRQVRPRYCFLENVRGLLSSGYFQEILKDLAQSGYDARWRVLSAAELGAPHKRDRLWIVAYANSEFGIGRGQSQESFSSSRETRSEFGRGDTDVADANSQWQSQSQGAIANIGRRLGDGVTEVPHSTIDRLEERWQTAWQLQSDRFTYNSWWETEPDVGRLADGVSNRVERLKAAGNAQVPVVAATAWRLLTEG